MLIMLVLIGTLVGGFAMKGVEYAATSGMSISAWKKEKPKTHEPYQIGVNQFLIPFTEWKKQLDTALDKMKTMYDDAPEIPEMFVYLAPIPDPKKMIAPPPSAPVRSIGGGSTAARRQVDAFYNGFGRNSFDSDHGSLINRSANEIRRLEAEKQKYEAQARALSEKYYRNRPMVDKSEAERIIDGKIGYSIDKSGNGGEQPYDQYWYDARQEYDFKKQAMRVYQENRKTGDRRIIYKPFTASEYKPYSSEQKRQPVKVQSAFVQVDPKPVKAKEIVVGQIGNETLVMSADGMHGRLVSNDEPVSAVLKSVDEYTVQELEKMTKSELWELAAENCIEMPNKILKADMVKTIYTEAHKPSTIPSSELETFIDQMWNSTVKVQGNHSSTKPQADMWRSEVEKRYARY